MISSGEFPASLAHEFQGPFPSSPPLLRCHHLPRWSLSPLFPPGSHGDPGATCSQPPSPGVYVPLHTDRCLRSTFNNSLQKPTKKFYYHFTDEETKAQSGGLSGLLEITQPRRCGVSTYAQCGVFLRDPIFPVNSCFLGNECSLWEDINLTFFPLHDHAGLREANEE